MAPTTKAEVQALESQLSEAQQAIARLFQSLNDTISNVATLTKNVAELQQGMKRMENWAKEQIKNSTHDNSINRYE